MTYTSTAEGGDRVAQGTAGDEFLGGGGNDSSIERSDLVFQGTTGDDYFVGGGGNDTFLIGYGGSDVAIGGSGNDLFYVATGVYGPVRPTVSITGGGGTDTLQIQSRISAEYGPLALRPHGSASTGDGINASGISTIQFLSGYDSSRGWAAGAPMSYFIAIENGFAPLGAPLVLDTTRLAADEGLYIAGGWLQDPNVVLHLIGGAGDDRIHAAQGGSYLDGGAGDDELRGHMGDDVLLGGAGSDELTRTWASAVPAPTFSMAETATTCLSSSEGSIATGRR